MIIGIGIDIVDISRMRKAIERTGDRFLHRVFTKAEMKYCEGRKSKYQHYAARFAAKEATFKALGTGWSGGIAWRDAEIAVEESGKPLMVLHGQAKVIAEKQGVRSVHASLSHSGEYALAHIVLSN